jgi:hypothetical protein
MLITVSALLFTCVKTTSQLDPIGMYTTTVKDVAWSKPIFTQFWGPLPTMTSNLFGSPEICVVDWNQNLQHDFWPRKAILKGIPKDMDRASPHLNQQSFSRKESRGYSWLLRDSPFECFLIIPDIPTYSNNWLNILSCKKRAAWHCFNINQRLSVLELVCNPQMIYSKHQWNSIKQGWTVKSQHKSTSAYLICIPSNILVLWPGIPQQIIPEKTEMLHQQRLLPCQPQATISAMSTWKSHLNGINPEGVSIIYIIIYI